MLPLLERADVVLLPHAVGSMLVSGAFFEAVGRARAVLARRTPFTQWASERLPGIFLFENDADIPAVVQRIRDQWPTVEAADARQAVLLLFGRERCVQDYGAVLG